MANNIGEEFKGEYYSEENICLPHLKDYLHNSLEPLIEREKVLQEAYKYVEDPIGGEDGIGFLQENSGIFSFHCDKEAFDLSDKALFTGMMDGDSFALNLAHKSVSVGSAELRCSDETVEKNKKFLASFKSETRNYPKDGDYDKAELDKYLDYIELQLGFVNAPETGHFVVGRILDSLVTKKEFRELDAFSGQYRHLYFKPEFETEPGKASKAGATSSNNDVTKYLNAYESTSILHFYKGRQVWRIEDAPGPEGYGLYYIYNYGANVDVNKQEVAYQIRNAVYDKISKAKKVIIQVPSTLYKLKGVGYAEFVDTEAKNRYPDQGVWYSLFNDTSFILNGIFSPSWYLYSGFNTAGMDENGRVVAIIYLKVEIEGVERWINLNKYILWEFVGKVENLTENANNSAGVKTSLLYLDEGLHAFNPDTYNINIANYQDSLIKQSLEDIKQDARRKEIQLKSFANAGYSLCKTEEDLYKWTVSVGDVSFFVPPTQIKVTNTTQTERLPILRAKGTMAKQGEKTESSLEINLYFNNDDGINGYPMTMDLWEKKYLAKGEKYKTSSDAFKNDSTKIKEGDNGLRTYYMNGLRALLSEFHFCPFLPIINKYINETLNIHAVSLEQILVKTVPNFPRLLQVTLVMKKFDYNVYMPELPQPYKLKPDSPMLVNPFDQCINYDVLRYYYQRPILRGNELQKKLDAGGEYSFNSIPFIKDTLFANRTAYMPCKFEDPTITVYVADEDYLEDMLTLRRTLWQKKLQGQMDGTGYGSFNKKMSENDLKIVDLAADLYSSLNSIHDTYANRIEEIKLTTISQIHKLRAVENNDRYDNLNIENIKIPYGTTEYSLNDTMLKHVAIPLKRDVEAALKDKKNEAGQPLIKRIYFANHGQEVSNIENLLHKEEKPYALKLIVELNSGLLVNEKDIKEVAEQAFIGVDGYSKLSDVPLVFNSTQAFVFSLTDLETNYDEEDSQKWINAFDKDWTFVSYCFNNKETINKQDELLAELKDAMDHETVKSVKFKEYLKDAIVADFEAGLNNNFARISVLEAEESAAQYMGSSDTYISWHIRTKDADTVALLKNLPSYEAHCMRNYHEVLPCFPIRIDSEFTRLIGVHEVSVESVDATTIPNMPGVYDVVIRTISTDRTLRNRETLRAINDADEFEKDPNASVVGEMVDKSGKPIDIYGDVIDNSGLKQGKIRSQIKIRTREQLELKLAKSELYPDLELPTIQELAHLGFRFIRYMYKEREANVRYVDPDFYMFYSHVIFSEIIKKQVESTFGYIEEEDKVKQAKKKAQNMLQYSISDLTGAQVPINMYMEPDMSQANKPMQEIHDKLVDRLKREQSAYNKLETRRELAKRFPALFIADKGIWNIGQKIICSFKESYIVNLENEIAKAERNKEVLGKDKEELKNTFIKEKFDCFKKNNINTPIITQYVPKLGADTDTSSYLTDYVSNQLMDYSEKYEDAINSLKIETSSDFYKAIDCIIRAISAVNCGSFEYNTSLSDPIKWQGTPYKVFAYRKDGRVISKKDEANFSELDSFSAFKIKKYTKQEILPLLHGDDKEEVTKAPENKKVFVLDPYYRMQPDSVVEDYLYKCAGNYEYAKEAEFRILFWWLEKLYCDAKLFPSFSFDIARRQVLSSNQASHDALEIIKKHADNNDLTMSNNSILVDNNTLKSMSDYVKGNSLALDIGKFFIAALFSLLGKSLEGDNRLYQKMVTRDYDYLNSYIQGITSFNSALREKLSMNDDLKVRRFMLALVGCGLIKGPEYVGRSTGVTPAQQFYSNYSTKFAIAACLNPNQYIYHSFYDMIRGDYRGRLLRAFPTFYCMFIDEGKEIGLWKINDNFYSINGINEITVTKSRKLATDTCSITLSNNYGTFTMDDEDSYINYMGDFFGELYESLFDQSAQAERAQRKRRMSTLYVNKAKLSPGIRIHVRVGYGSDARELAGVFNGVIAEVQPKGNVVEIVAQGNGIELMNQITYDKDADELAFLDEGSIVNRVGVGATPREILKILLTTKGGAKDLYFQGKYSKDQYFFKSGERHWDTDFTFGLAEFLNARKKSNFLGITHFGDPEYKDIFPEGEALQNIYEVNKYPSLAVPGLELYNDILETDGIARKPEINKFSAIKPTEYSEDLSIIKAKQAIEAQYNEVGLSMSDIDWEQNQEALEQHAARNLNTKGPRISFNSKGKTFWDAMNICQSVALDYICYYAPFGFRDTIFLGKPYYYYAYDYANINGSFIEKRKPFQQYHVYYSVSDIIQNDITASSVNMKTVATGYYQEDNGYTTSSESVGPLYIDKDIFVENQRSFVFDTRLLLKPDDKWYISKSSPEEFWNDQKNNENIAFDTTINTIKNIGSRAANLIGNGLEQLTSCLEERDEKTENLYNTHKKIAWIATANALKNNVKEMYQGGISVIGDPSVKPYDRLIITDRINDLNGHVLVRDVVHSLSMQTGFTSTMNVDAISIVDDRSEFYTHSMSNSLASLALFGLSLGGLNWFGNKYIKKINKELQEQIANAKKAYDDCSYGFRVLEANAEFNNRSLYFKTQQDLVDVERKIAETLPGSESLKELEAERDKLQKTLGEIIQKDSIFTEANGDIATKIAKFNKEYTDDIDNLKKYYSQESELVSKLEKAVTNEAKLDIEKELAAVRKSITDTSKKLDAVKDSIRDIKKATYSKTEVVANLIATAKHHGIDIDIDAIDDFKGTSNFIESIRAKYKELLGDVVGAFSESPNTARKEFFNNLQDINEKLRRLASKETVKKIGSLAKEAVQKDGVSKAVLKGTYKLALLGPKALYNGLLLLGGGPIALAAKEFVYYLGVECLCQSVNNYLYYGIRNAQALTVFPLKKHGFVYTAGLEGSVGCVFGSPSYNQKGFLDTLISYAAPGPESSTLTNILYAVLASEDLVTEMEKVRRNNDFYNRGYSNSIGKESVVESSVWGVAPGTASRKFTTICEMSTVDRTKIPSRDAKPEEKKAFKEKYTKLMTMKEFVDNNMVTGFTNLETDPDFKKYSDIGFLKLLHVEALNNASKLPDSGEAKRITKLTESSNKVDIPCIYYKKNVNGAEKEIIDIPYLGHEAKNVLLEILDYAYKTLPTTNSKDIYQISEDTKNNHIIIYSALRVGDEKNVACAAGASFTIKGIGQLNDELYSIVLNRKKEAEKENGQGNCLFEFKRLAKSGEQYNQIQVIIKPPETSK